MQGCAAEELRSYRVVPGHQPGTEQQDADADRILYRGYGSPGSTNQDAVLGGALWKALGAVKSAQARPVSDETWFLGLGVTAVNAVLADLKGFVATGS